ncbi:MAG: hypothetical protein LUH51_07845 [Firmicutes bacterium]|nr:hypothetical protein [Bacillota bacterium]
MNRQISFGQYRAIDLTFLAAALAVSQAAISIAASTVYADQLYVVSTVAAITALVMMRWGFWAAIHAVLGGLVFVALARGGWQQYLIYGVGNLFSLLAMLLIGVFGKEKIRQNVLLTMLFALCTQLFMQLGRAGIACLLGYGIDACLGFITTDALSILFTVCILWVARRVEGLFEDQKHYLLRVQREQQDEGREPN